MPKYRSRRLRKKLRIEEFQEFCFSLRMQLKSDLPAETIEALIDELLSEVIEPRNLAFAGWASEAFIAKYGRGTVTEEDQAAVISWIQQRPEVVSVEASELVDAWHGQS